ncbi:MAG TPA: TolC family protein [Flavobacterium sp.]|uniref:TolC family protein n=1 Tax=Flavobacterium sp. TaxID=239 RepID=UPI002DB87C50|nr:TolC family protein [Flavobacterium sp.]HEU4792007.1 TolC family protein [Flavobacterium sp.]
MKHKLFLKGTMIISSLVFSIAASAQSKALSLEECRKMALENNKRIISAQLQVDAAKANYEVAKTNALPTIDASVMGVHLGNPLDQIQVIPSDFASASIDVKQPIYAGGKIKLNKEASSKTIEVYQSQKVLTETEVLLGVEKGYWLIVQAKEKVTLAQKYREMLKSLRQDLKNAVDAGLTYKNDLLRSEVNLNQAELNIIKANDALVLAKLNFSQIIGQAGDTNFAITDEVSGDFTSLLEIPNENVADNRPEIDMLKKAIDVEKIKTKIIKAEVKPQVGLSLSGFSSYGDKINFSNGNDNLTSYYSTIGLTMPVFDWGKNRKKVKEQNFKIQSKQAELEEQKELVDIEVQNAYLQLNQSVKRINLSNSSLKQADENLRLANDRYRVGTIIGKDVLEAQVIWQEAYSNTIDSKVEYKVNVANYKKAIGELK